MDLSAALDRHHTALAALHAGSVTYSGSTYTVPVGISAVTLELEEGGSRPGDRLETRIPKTALATAPKVRDTLTHAGVVYVIESVLGKETWAREWVIVAVR